MLDTGRYLYVGFMCHQVIEKALKAVIAANDNFPPKIHRLRRPAEPAGLLTQMDEDKLHFIDILEPLNIESRYPNEMMRLSSELNIERSQWIINKTQEMYEWIKTTL